MTSELFVSLLKLNYKTQPPRIRTHHHAAAAYKAEIDFLRAPDQEGYIPLEERLDRYLNEVNDGTCQDAGTARICQNGCIFFLNSPE